MLFLLHLSSGQLVWSRDDCNSQPHLKTRFCPSLPLSPLSIQGAMGDEPSVTSLSHHINVTCFTLESIRFHNMFKWFLLMLSYEKTADDDCHRWQAGNRFQQDSSHDCQTIVLFSSLIILVHIGPELGCLPVGDFDGSIKCYRLLKLSWVTIVPSSFWLQQWQESVGHAPDTTEHTPDTIRHH